MSKEHLMDRGFEYLARDMDGALYAYKDKPEKRMQMWVVPEDAGDSGQPCYPLISGEMGVAGTVKGEDEEQTKIKCIKQNCTGTYVKSDFKYSCKTCQMYIVKGLKKQVAFSDAQLKKLLKGETIVHPFTPVVDGEAIKAETKPMNWYIDKASGILKKSEIKDI